MKKLILLNGPMNCGKTSIVKHLNEVLGLPVIPRLCKDKLHQLVMELYSVPAEEYWKIYNNRDIKEVPLEQFKMSPFEYNRLMEYIYPGDISKKSAKLINTMVNVSIRNAMIYVSELICKPAYGQDYFGQSRIKSMSDNEIAIDDSTGFPEELPPAIDMLGQKNIILIRIRGRGSYDGDSRDYIPDGVIDNTIDIDNSIDGPEAEEKYINTITGHIVKFLNYM